MLPIDPSDGQGSVTPAQPSPGSPVLPEQAMAYGSTILRPGAVAWGSHRDTLEGAYPSCEAVERLLALVTSDAGQLGILLAELTKTRVWVPLPVAPQRFTDGAAIVLPTVQSGGIDFIPCFTSVQRLNSWATGGGAAVPGAGTGEYGFTDVGRRWQRAGDSRVVPHIVVPAGGLTQRLPPGTGMVLNPDSEAGLPLYPECVAYLATLADRLGPVALAGSDAPAEHPQDLAGSSLEQVGDQAEHADLTADSAAADANRDAGGSLGARVQVSEPPAEPVALLREALADLRALPAVREAARAWLTVPGAGEGLVISVTLDDPTSERDRAAVVAALEAAVAEVPLQVPFPVDVTFPGEGEPDAVDAWVAKSAHPFYTRSEQ
jgi:hypothetical protein